MPAGRPSKIDQIVRYRDRDGERVPVTAFDQVIGLLRVGNYIETAAASAGVHRETVHAWLRTGAQAVARAATRGLDLDDPALNLTDHEQRCIEFSDAVAEATSSWEVQAIGTLEQLGRGGYQTTRVTIKTERVPDASQPSGFRHEEVERTTVTETLPPSAQVLEWRLTRRYPQRYAINPDREVEATGAEDVAGQLADELRTYLTGVEDGKGKPRKRAARKPSA